MAKEIPVILLEDGDKDYLRLYVDESNELDIDLNSHDQTYLREIYKKLILLSLNEKVILNLEYDKGYNKSLFKEIAFEFIKSLNHELERIHEDVTLQSLEVG